MYYAYHCRIRVDVRRGTFEDATARPGTCDALRAYPEPDDARTTIRHRSGGSSLTTSRRYFRSSGLRDGARPSSMELRLLAARSISMLDRGDRGGAVSSESYMGTPQPTSETSDERRRKKQTFCFSPKTDGNRGRDNFEDGDESACELRHAGRPEACIRARAFGETRSSA